MPGIGPQPCVDDEEEHRNPFGERRGDGCSGDAQCRKTPFPENKHIVEHHVGKDHDDRIARQYAGAGRGDVERPEHGGGEREEKTVDAPVQIADGGGVDLVRFDEQPQQLGPTASMP